MSWGKPLEYDAPRGVARRRGSAAFLSGVPGGRSRPFMTLSLRLSMLTGVGWLVAGERVDVLPGQDEHGSMLAVRPSIHGKLVLFTLGRPDKQDTVSLRLPWLRGVKPSKAAATPMHIEVHSEHLVVTLPPWALPPADIQEGVARAAAAADAARQRAGYIGVTARMADPAAVDRARTPRSMGA